jgi:glucose-1-phosphate cytidylyltransferase
VQSVHPISKAGLWINGGFFIFRSDIFRYIRDGEELVEQPFRRLIQEGQLIGHKYEGYWSCMDTFKERQQLEDRCHRGDAPWEVWKSAENSRFGTSPDEWKSLKKKKALIREA